MGEMQDSRTPTSSCGSLTSSTPRGLADTREEIDQTQDMITTPWGITGLPLPPPPLYPPPKGWTPGRQEGLQDFSEVENIRNPTELKPQKVRQISYSFYSKPLASKYVILENSAASYQSKKASLAQECVRRLLNTSDDRKQEEKEQIINDYQKKLGQSGYSLEQQKEIVESGLLGYVRRIERQGGVKHRQAKDTESIRGKKKILGKSNWFKNRGGEKGKEKSKQGNQDKDQSKSRGYKRKRGEGESNRDSTQGEREPTTVVFVPRTRGGELAKRLKMKEEELGKITSQKVRIVERNGERLEHLLTKTDPFGDPKCSKESCLLCKTSKKEKGTCKKKNLVYKISCKICQEQGREGVYWGETSRTGQERGGEHWKSFKNTTGQNQSHMREHIRDKHPEADKPGPAENWFSMEVHKRYSTALERQLGEALCIARAGGMDSENVMNRRDEYNRCMVPELQVEERWKGESRKKRERERADENQTQETQNNPKKRPRRENRDQVPQGTTEPKGEGITATRHPNDPQATAKKIETPQPEPIGSQMRNGQYTDEAIEAKDRKTETEETNIKNTTPEKTEETNTPTNTQVEPEPKKKTQETDAKPEKKASKSTVQAMKRKIKEKHTQGKTRNQPGIKEMMKKIKNMQTENKEEKEETVGKKRENKEETIRKEKNTVTEESNTHTQEENKETTIVQTVSRLKTTRNLQGKKEVAQTHQPKIKSKIKVTHKNKNKSERESQPKINTYFRGNKGARTEGDGLILNVLSSGDNQRPKGPSQDKLNTDKTPGAKGT